MRLEFEGKRSVEDILNEDIAGNLDLSTLKPDTTLSISTPHLQQILYLEPTPSATTQSAWQMMGRLLIKILSLEMPSFPLLGTD